MTNVLELLALKNDKGISISPNPFYGKLYLKSDVALTNSRVVLLDNSGKEVFSQKLLNGKGTEVEIKNSNNGTYFIIVLENEQIVYSEKIVKGVY